MPSIKITDFIRENNQNQSVEIGPEDKAYEVFKDGRCTHYVLNEGDALRYADKFYQPGESFQCHEGAIFYINALEKALEAPNGSPKIENARTAIVESMAEYATSDMSIIGDIRFNEHSRKEPTLFLKLLNKEQGDVLELALDPVSQKAVLWNEDYGQKYSFLFLSDQLGKLKTKLIDYAKDEGDVPWVVKKVVNDFFDEKVFEVGLPEQRVR